MLKLIYGKSGSGKSSYCFTEIARLIEKEEKNKIFIITPEQFSFTAERKLMDEMEKLGTGAVISAEVITLSRMAYRVMQEVGGGIESLSKCGKAMLIYSILSNNQKNLKFLGKTDENIDLSMRAITEFKKHGISVENLVNEIQCVEDIYLKNKLQDMVCIYKEFEEKIEGNYIEDTDLLTILSQNIGKVDLVKNSIIYIDEFAGFTYQEYQVIKEFLRLAKEVNITICIDNLDFNTNPDIDIYYPNKITAKKLINLAKENDIGLDKFVHLEEGLRFKTEELRFLSKNLYNTKSTKYGKNVENVSLFLAKNEYSEVENVAKKIQNLVRKEKMRYRDISIITKNIENYSSLVRAIFRKYDIPVFIDEKRDLNQNIIVQYILSILEILTKNFSFESVFSYIKLGFLDYEKEEIFKLENYCSKWGIKQNKFKKDFTYEIDDENKKKEIERLNEIRKEIINPLVKLQEEIKYERTVKNITILLYNFLLSQDIEGKLSKKIKELEEKGLIDLAREYKESYSIIIDIFDEMILIFNEEKLSIDKYQKILKIGLKNSGLGKIPGTADQVILGDVDRSRSHKVRVVFILGLNDGIFPSSNKDEGFLNDDDRKILKQNGIELAKNTIEQLYDDKFNIYKAFTTAEEKIYLSYSSSDKDGKSLRPSILVTQIKKMYPNIKEESDVINKKYEIINKDVTYEELIENIAKIKNKEEIDKIWYQVYNYYKSQEKWNKKLEEDLEGLEYTNIPKKIKQENIDKLYGNILKTSISKLEKYRSCPFSYYLQYGLKLKEKESLQMQSLNTGTFMHETIDSFFKYVKEQNINLAEIEEKEILEIVSRIINESLNLNKNFIFTATAKYRALVIRLKRIIAKALKYIIQTIIYSDFEISGTEVEFTEKGKYKPIILELENGKKIEITGKIDRIDTANSEERKIFKNNRL